MNDLDTLRPEVREAINRTDMAVEMFDTLVTVNRDDYDLIRTELLRLAVENAMVRGALETLDVEGHKRAEKAEAELAALKAKIEGAPVVACPKTLVHAGNTMQTEFLEYTHERMPGGCNSWAGKRVRLVVEE